MTSADCPPRQPGYHAEFPIVLSAGERRAYTANDIFRDPSWRKRDADGALRVSIEDAEALGLTDGGRVRITTAAGSAEASVEISEAMLPGHVSLPNGSASTTSTLTAARRPLAWPPIRSPPPSGAMPTRAHRGTSTFPPASNRWRSPSARPESRNSCQGELLQQAMRRPLEHLPTTTSVVIGGDEMAADGEREGEHAAGLDVLRVVGELADQRAAGIPYGGCRRAGGAWQPTRRAGPSPGPRGRSEAALWRR